MTTGKTMALTRWTFVGKVMSLLFNMLSWFVIAFLPRSKCLLISGLQSLSTEILEPKKMKSVTFPLFPRLFAIPKEKTEQFYGPGGACRYVGGGPGIDWS